MHYRFEIELMTKQIVGSSAEESRINHDWLLKYQHIKRYLFNYYKTHAVLPTGRRYLGMTRPRYLEIGMVDLGVIRQKIQSNAEDRVSGELDNPKVLQDLAYSTESGEVEASIAGRATEKWSSRTIVDLRQAFLARQAVKGHQDAGE